MSIWKEPTSKNAYILGCIGVILTLIASIAGIGFYLVRSINFVGSVLPTFCVCVLCVCIAHLCHSPMLELSYGLSAYSPYTTYSDGCLPLLSVCTLLYAQSNGSVLCLVFGLENVVDLLSDFVVVWRFYSPGRLTREHEELLQRRELRASVAISFILVLLGLSVIATSLDDFVSGPETDQELKAVIVIAFTSVFIFGTLAIFKFHYARKLESESLYKDGICRYERKQTRVL